MRKTFKYRLYPTKEQAEYLEGQLAEACRLYNAALQERRDAWHMCRKSLNYYDQANQLKAIRADGNLVLANYSACQDVLRRVDKTFQAFSAGLKQARRQDSPGSSPSVVSIATLSPPTVMAASSGITASFISRE